MERQKLKGEKGKMLNGCGVCETGPIFRRRSSHETSRLCTANCIVSLHFTPMQLHLASALSHHNSGLRGSTSPKHMGSSRTASRSTINTNQIRASSPCKHPLTGTERGPHCLLPELINDTATIATR